jgi:DNA-binding XRE family transcriptional regulator
MDLLLNTLETSRNVTAFTQADVGSLLGLSADAIYNYEEGRRSPSLAVALGLELVFGKSLSQLYPDTALAVAEKMIGPLQTLSIRVEGKTGAKADAQREAIASLSDRLARIIPGV